ncbi:MAG: hypothetical protein IRZ16_02985 [Myxococcaceae bacterium]|nr:hypothetical protein [Myxococcaceae bacterium]
MKSPLLHNVVQSPLADRAWALPNLVRFCERMKARYDADTPTQAQAEAPNAASA